MKYRIPRIYYPVNNIHINNEYYLLYDTYHYFINVLRMRINQKIEIFNNSDIIYYANIINTINKKITIKIITYQNIRNTSHMHIHLIQSISNYDMMKFIIQKSTELGIHEISPIISKKSKIKIISRQYTENKLKKWNKICIAACMQCGRHKIPKINAIQKIKTWFTHIKKKKHTTNIVCHPYAISNIHTLKKLHQNIQLLIGPKSGLTETEIYLAKKNNFLNISLGNNILKSETATIVAITILKCIN